MKLTFGNSLRALLSTFGRQPGRLLQALRNQAYNLEMEHQVHSRYGFESGLPTLAVPDLLPGLHESIHSYTYKMGTSLAIEIAIMKALAARKPGTRFLEIGSYLGEAIANVADTGAECVSLSLGDEDMRRLGFADHIAANRFFIKHYPNIHNVEADTHRYDFAGLGMFDLVFIDGDHTYEGVLNDTQKTVAHCSTLETVILWHDYADKAGVRWPVLSAILDSLPEAYRSRLFYLENTLSAIYVPPSMHVPAGKPFDPVKAPAHAYDIEIKAKAVQRPHTG